MVQQPLPKPVINRLSAGLIVIMAEVEAHVTESIWRAKKLVDVLNGRAFDRQRVFRPIPARRD